MKTKISRIGKKSLSLVIVMMMVVSMMLVGMVSASAAVSTVYLKPSSDWTSNSSVTNYITYFWIDGGASTEVLMQEVSDNPGYYYADVPSGVTKCIFVAAKANTLGSNWSNKIYQTGDLTIGDNALCTVTGTGTGTWSTYSGGGGTDTPTDTTYYIGGRFRVRASADSAYTYTYDSGNWSGDSKKIALTDDDGDGIFTLNTYCTLTELSEKLPESGTQYDPLFFIHNGSGPSGTWYGKTSGIFNASTTSITLDDNSKESTDNNNGLIKFSGTSDGNVIIKFNPITMELSYTVEGSDTPDEPSTLSAGTTVYVRSKTEIISAKLTSTLDGNAQETEVSMVPAGKDTGENYFSGDVNGYYYYAYTLLKDADSITFDVTLKSGTSSFTTTCVEDKNVYDIDNSTWSVYEIDKTKAYTSGLWVDTQPDVKNSSVALLKWTNKSGSNGTTGSTTYSLYLPSGVTASELPIYSKFSSLKIDGNSVANGTAYSGLTASAEGVEHKVVGDSTTYTLTVYQSTSSSIYTYTPKDLPTEIGQTDKPKLENGAFMTVDKNGAISNELMTLVQIKGRGNSSWEASGKLFGKYAYNIKLSSKIKPLDMGGTKAKSFCLLANNMDEALLRNMVTFQIGEDAGIPFIPNFKSVDWYNNGEYLGTYLITEKVDVGSSKLVVGETVEDYHSYDEDTANKHEATYSNSYGSGKFQYVDTGDCSTDYTKLSYLLEFDLKSRAVKENSWFQTPKGQYVTVKAYEDLNKAEMEFIIEKWCAAEDAVYNNDYSTANELMDLDTFAQVYLVQEFSKNLDAGATSYYVYYDGTQDSPKWQATPLWDYDWAYGEYTKGSDKPAGPSNAENFSSNLTSTAGWFAKYKYITYEGTYYEDGKNGLQSSDYKYNLQAQLANMTNFWNNNVKGVWNDNFYKSALGVFGTSGNKDGKIDTFYLDNSGSFALNEARYGFVASDPLVKADWGSQSTGNSPEKAYEYLKNWGIDRINWMATTGGLGIPEEPITLATPTITATTSDGARLPATIEEGTEFTITATTTDSGVTFVLYDNGTEVESNTTGTFTITATVGTHSYTVKTTSGDVTSTASNAVEVTVTEKVVEPTTFSVVLEADQTRFTTTGDTVNLTATINNADSESTYTYEFYYSTDDEISDDDTVMESSTNTSSAVLDEKGDYFYYVKVTDGTDTKYSEVIKVSVSAEVTIYFKAPSAASYTPYVSVNGATPIVMEKYQNIGKIFSGTLTIYWYSAKIDLDPTQEYTLTFTTRRTKVNASITRTFTSDAYYLAVDNLMTGTEVSDLTDEPEYIRNYYYSATHMVYAGDFEHKTTLGFTNVGGVRYNVGAYLDANGTSTLSIKSSTLIQKLAADATTTSEIQEDLLDVNLDGTVDVTDATMVQKALVNG